MPARWQACLTTCCVFCRGPLMEVWNTKRSFLPSFSRTPPAPRFQPAASRIAFALSTLNSNFAFGLRKRVGLLITVPVAMPARP